MVSMEFYGGHNIVGGRVPEYGAIFMSNRATREECFRRKLLGLPLGQADFVKQVKAGMILFLFEFESRELHGVYQACSDGDINIVPHAYQSSGKQFPAQVKFIQIWHCNPLPEDEFRDAIRENYFLPFKFNFGLSERQVQKLLLLFSSRKIKDGSLRRQSIQSKVLKPVGYSVNETRRVADEDCFVLIDRKKGRKKRERNANASFGSAISLEYHGKGLDDDRYASPTFRSGHKIDRLLISKDQFGVGKDGRLADDGLAVTRKSDMDLESRPVISANFSGHTSPARRSSDNVNRAASYGSVHEPNVDNDFWASKHPIVDEGSLINDHFQQSSATRHLVEPRYSEYSSQLSLEANSLARCSMELQNSKLPFSALDGDEMPVSNVFYSTSRGDLVSTGSLPCDLDAPMLDSKHSSSLRLSNLAAECCLPNANVFPSYEDQSFPSHLEPKGTRKYANLNSCSSDYIPLSYPNHHEDLNGSGMLFQDADYLENISQNSSGNESCILHARRSSSLRLSNSVPEFPPCDSIIPSFGNQSFPSCVEPKSRNINACLSNDNPLPCPNLHKQPNKASMPFVDAFLEDVANSSRNERISRDVSSCSRSLNRSSSVFDGRHSVSSQDHWDCQIGPHENNGAFSASVSVLEVASTGHRDYHKNYSVHPDVCQISEGMYSDRQKRKSVFSRIALPSELQEEDGHDMDSSVDEVMATLRQSRNQWVKEKNFKQQTRRHGEVCMFKNKKQTTLNTKSLGDRLPKVSKEITLNTRSLVGRLPKVSKEINLNSKPMIDRLPKVSKEISMNDISPAKEDGFKRVEEIPFVDFKRRRKEQRVQSDANTGDYNDATGNGGLSDHQHKIRKLIRPKFSDNESSGKVMVGSQDNESKITQNVGLSDVTFHIVPKDRNLGSQSCSNFEGQEVVESFSVSKGNADEDGEQALQNVVMHNASCVVSSKYESDVKKSCITIPEVDGLSISHGNANYSALQDSFSKSFEGKCEPGFACPGLDHDGGNENLSKHPEVENNFFPTRSKSEIGRVVAIGVATGSFLSGTMDYNSGSGKVPRELGNAEENNQQLFLKSVGGRFKASFENVNCSDMKESQEIYEGNDRFGDVLAAAASKDCKMDFEREDIGSGKHSPCEITLGQSQISSN